MSISNYVKPAVSRRQFLMTGAAASVAIAGKVEGAASESFTFVHMTDTHIQPELHATEGCRMAFDKVNSVKADFIIHGGDLVNGVEKDGPPRARGFMTYTPKTPNGFTRRFIT